MLGKKFAVVLFVLLVAQGLSAGICWLMFKEVFVIPTLAGSLLPAVFYLKTANK